MWYINVVLYQALGTALCSTGSELVLYNVTLRMCMFLMRDEKEERKKQARSNKQGKAMYVHVYVDQCQTNMCVLCYVCAVCSSTT